MFLFSTTSPSSILFKYVDNVNKKLKLYYGERTQGIIIESEAGKGSKISFTIPADINFAEETKNV